MRYLITIENIDTNAPLALQQSAQLLEQTVIPTLEACAKLEAEQKILGGGVAVGSGSSTLVVEAGSDEELNQLVHSLPAWGTLKVTVTPLQSFQERVQHDRQALERSRTAEGQPARELHQRLGQLRDYAGK